MSQDVQAKIDQINAELAAINAKESFTQDDTDRRNQLINQLSELEHELKQQQEREQQHEVRVQTAVQESQDWLDSVEIAGMPIQSFFPQDYEFGLFKMEIKQRFADQATRLSQEIIAVQAECNDRMTGANEERVQLQRQIVELQKRLRESDENNSSLAGTISQLRLELEDANAKRDNAAKELEEANKIIEQKEGHLDELRKQVALGVGGAIRVVDAEQEAKKAEMERLAKLNRVVYDLKGTREINPLEYTAKKAINDEEITIKTPYLKAYTVLNDRAEVERFRSEHNITTPTPEIPAAAPVDSGSVPQDIPVPVITPPVVEAPRFPEVPSDGREVEGDSHIPEVVGQVTREEFEALKERVAKLEGAA